MPSLEQPSETVRDQTASFEARALRTTGEVVTGGSPEDVLIEGALRPAPQRLWARLLRWCSGWAIAAGLIRFVAWILGVRRVGRARTRGGAIELERETRWLGRTIAARREKVSPEGLISVERRTRFSGLVAAIGVLFLMAGWLIGSVLWFDGIRTGEALLFALGATIAGAGSALDFFLDLWASREHAVSICIRVLRGQPFLITGIDPKDADQFLRSLSSRPGPTA